MKDELVPFIGDIFLTDRGIFQGTCVNGNLPVSDLQIQDNVFEVEVNLRSGIDKNQLNEPQAHVVIGIDVEIKVKDDVIQPGLVQANVFRGQETVTLPVGIPVLSGRMNVLQYRLVPIEFFQILDNDLNDNKSLNFNPRDLENISVFQDFNTCIEEADDMAKDEDVLSVMPLDLKRKLKDIQRKLRNSKEEFSLACFNALQEMSSVSWARSIYTLIVGIESCRAEAENCSSELKAFRTNLKGKISFLELLKGMGIKYVSDPRVFNRALKEDDCFALFFNEDLVKNNPTQFRKTIEFFTKFIERAIDSGKESQEFIAVDLDVIPKNELRVPAPKKVVIYHARKDELQSLDLMNDLEKRTSFNTAKCDKRGNEIESKKRGKFIFPCPNSLRGGCSKDYHEWLCEECNVYFDYGFNDCLYCNCADGKGTNLKEFRFRCSDIRHGFDYVRYSERCADYFDQITPMENISIIILGQSGVGKSTWINGMINYILYNDIKIAKESNIVTAIPTKFTITDQYYQTQVIEVGNDENEDTGTVGASGTQDCRTYNIRYRKNNKDYNMQLIDTPGLGDSRGIEQDKKNVKKILDHIRYFDKLHGFCILLKPNESKIGVLMKFCIKEILTHLHKSCAENIVYCFTNARATFYRPGDTLPVLRKLLEEIEVHIKLNRDTIYCFDNESYRYLCTFNYKGVKYTKEDEKSFEESWDRSVVETKRLLDYVIDLRPHRTQETLTLNQSRRMILSLTRPIADITHNIEMNIQVVSDHKKLIESLDERDKNLLKNLYVPQVALENVPLGHPRTICTAVQCVRYHTLPESGMQLTEYVTHCHPHCYLQNVTPETYPNPDLKHCAAMSGSVGGEWCHGCRCSWKTHMHILYEQQRTEIRVKNQSVDTNIGNKADLRKEKEEAIDNLESQVARLKDEKKKIIQIAGKFAYFLKKHAITAYNDCFCDYLDYLIDAEEGKRYKTDKEKSILDNLKKTKATYEEEIKFLETAMANSPDTGHYDPADVEEWKEELYNLPIHGKQLKDNMTVVLQAEDNAARYTQRNLTASKKTSSSGGYNSGGSYYGSNSGAYSNYGSNRGAYSNSGSNSGAYSNSGSGRGGSSGYGNGASSSGYGLGSMVQKVTNFLGLSNKPNSKQNDNFAHGNPNHNYNHNHHDDYDNRGRGNRGGGGDRGHGNNKTQNEPKPWNKNKNKYKNKKK